MITSMRYKDATHDWVFISDTDAKRVIDHASPLWKLPIRILYHYGLRASEVLSLTSDNLKGEELVIQRLKKGLTTRQYLLPDIRAELLAIAATRAPGSR